MKDYSYGNFICALREGAGLSQYQLGALVGVSDKAVSKWENGSAKPRVKTLYRLAAVLGVSVDELLSCEYDAHPGRKESQNLKNELWKRAEALLEEKYGGDMRCRSRFESEKAALKNSDIIIHFDILGGFLTAMRREGIPAFTHGLLGCSLVAWLLGATDVNPLPPHERCPKCGKLLIHHDARDGWDLPQRRCGCGETMQRDGHRIAIEGFADSVMRGAFDIDVLVPKSSFEQARAGLYGAYAEHYSAVQIICLPPDDAPTEAADSLKFILLPKNDKSACCEEAVHKMSSEEYLKKYRGFPTVNIICLDILEELQSLSGGKLCLDAGNFIREEGIRALLEARYTGLALGEELRPRNAEFSTLLQWEGLLHSAGVWENNGKEIVSRCPERLMELAAFRENVWDKVAEKLEEAGISERGLALTAMEDARLGRFMRKPEASCIASLRALGLPEWYVEHLSKIMYLFPKPHCVAHLMMELQLEAAKAAR